MMYAKVLKCSAGKFLNTHISLTTTLPGDQLTGNAYIQCNYVANRHLNNITVSRLNKMIMYNRL